MECLTKQAKKDKFPPDSRVPTRWVHFYFKSSLRDNSTLSLSLSLSPLSICPCLWHGGTFGLWGLFPILTPKALNHLRYNYPPHNYTQLCQTVKEQSSLLFLVVLGFISERQKLNRLAFKYWFKNREWLEIFQTTGGCPSAINNKLAARKYNDPTVLTGNVFH